MDIPPHPLAASQEGPTPDDPLTVLLRVARLLYTAAAQAELVTVSRDPDLILNDRLAEFDIKILLWQTLALLPPGLSLDQEEHRDHDDAVPKGVCSTLRAAIDELGAISLRGFPEGSSTLFTDLTAVVARLGISPHTPNPCAEQW